MSDSSISSKIMVVALYKFFDFMEFKAWQQPILENLKSNDIKGTILIAHEGINGTIAGTKQAVEATIAYLQDIPVIGTLTVKVSYTDEMPFYRTKVKLKKEIVTMGVTDINPRVDAGKYVKPEDWNDLISDPEVVLIDTRNDYEYQVGTFKNAVNPKTDTFREFPEYVKEHLDKDKHKKVAMFCTGGIRCEKSTAYLKQQGFENVYHLQGGVLQYFEDVETDKSLWDGDCFVFDNRVTVNQELETGNYDQCFACRMPISAEDKLNDKYVQGESCSHCHDITSLAQKQRFKDREKQLQLAKERGEQHIGGEVSEEIEKRRIEKVRLKQEKIEQVNKKD